MYTRVHIDTMSRKSADNMRQVVPCRIILVNGESPLEAIPTARQCNALTNVRRAEGRRGIALIPTDGEVIQLVDPGAYLLPNTQAKALRVGRTGRIHDLRAVRVPLHKRIVDDCSIWNVRVALGHELHLPHPHDRI